MATSHNGPPQDSRIADPRTGFLTRAWDSFLRLSFRSGSWTPTLTFATKGDLAVTYGTRYGSYSRTGEIVTVFFRIVTSAFTHTTAVGNLKVTGLPFAAKTAVGYGSGGAGHIRGYTNANFTMVTARIASSLAYLEFFGSGSAQVPTALAVADVPTAGTVILEYTISYQTD